MKKHGLILVLFCLSLPALAGKVYTYKDASGNLVYSDLPPQGGKNVTEKKLGANVIDTSGYPYELQQVIKRSPVTLWGVGCGELCDAAKKLLSDRGIPFVSKEPSASKELQEEFKKLTGGGGVPVLQVGAKTVNGFNDSNWNGALSAAGYPKMALKRIRPAPEPSAADKAKSSKR